MNKAVKGAIRSLSINEPPIFYPTLQVFKDNLSKAEACCNKILIELLLDKDKYAWWNAEVVKVGTELWKGSNFVEGTHGVNTKFENLDKFFLLV
jgi:hypothetical protein